MGRSREYETVGDFFWLRIFTIINTFFLLSSRIFKFRKVISNRETCYNLVSSDHPIYVDKLVEDSEHYRVFDGHFLSPLVHHKADLIPRESHKAYFQLVLPQKWPHRFLKPVCVQLAGTGDHVSLTLFGP